MTPDHARNSRGILLVVLAMFGFAVSDLFIKVMTTAMPVGQVLMTVGGGTVLLFLAMAARQRVSLMRRDAWSSVMLWRMSGDFVGSIGFMTALSLVDLSTVAAVFQATPLAVAMAAALFMQEQVGWRRWSAISVGFVGVLIIIRPGFSGFDPNMLWVLLSVAGVTVRDLLTRRADPAVPTVVLSVQSSLALVLAGVVTLLMRGTMPVWPDPLGLSMSAGAILFALIGIGGLMAALRSSDPSAVAPFRYTRLLFSLSLGMIVLGERPDLATYVGAGIVIASGLYTYLRERALARNPVRPAGDRCQ